MRGLLFVLLKSFFFFILVFTIPPLIRWAFFPTYVHGHIWPGLDEIFSRALMFSIGLAPILTAIHGWFSMRAAKEIGRQPDYRLRQTSETEISEPTQVLFEDLKKHLALRKWKILTSDEKTASLQFRTTPSFQSWGEIVSIHLTPLASDKTRVSVESRPRLKITFADNGKNLRNIQMIRNILPG